VATISWPWGIVLCRFSDRPAETQPTQYYRELFTENGTGGLCNYWRIATCGAFDLTGSRVFGWFGMSHPSSDVHNLTFPGDRWQLVQWGIDAAHANGVDLSSFRSVLVVHNYGVDHGWAGNGFVLVHQDPVLCEFGFISHEMGHGHGLPHSFAANPDFQYGDSWDVMSFATTTFQFPITFNGTAGSATVGLNARNLEALGLVPVGRSWTAPGPDFSSTVTLDPLSQPLLGSHGQLLVPRRQGCCESALAGREIGVRPFQAMTNIHIIQGKATMGANLMAAKVKGSGKYDYRVTKLSKHTLQDHVQRAPPRSKPGC
jgi:hypothetical protein